MLEALLACPLAVYFSSIFARIVIFDADHIFFKDNQEKTTMKPKVPPKKDNRPYKPFEPDTKKDKKACCKYCSQNIP